MVVKVWAIKGIDEFDLVTKINLFNEKQEVFATQIFQVTNGWVAYCYYKVNGETKNGK